MAMVSSKPDGRAEPGLAKNGPAETGHEGHGHALKHPVGESAQEAGRESDNDEFLVTAATIGVVGVGVVVLEAALLPGLILGVAAALAPRYLPALGGALSPLFKSTVRGAYKLGEKAREMAAEVQEQVNDIVAEAKVESDTKVDATDGLSRSAGAPPA
jgi:hypothetical protein